MVNSFRCRLLRATTVLLILALPLFATLASTVAMAQQNVLRLRPHVVVDPSGFGGPIAAVTLLTPLNWRASGGVIWNQQYACTHGFAIAWQVKSPDELSGAVFIPHHRWEYSSHKTRFKANISCPVLRITSVSQYLRLILKKIRPDARILGIRPRQDVLREFPKQRSSRRTQFGMQHIWLEAGEILFNVREKGVLLDGRITAVVEFEKNTTRTPALNSFGVVGYAHPAYGTFAPAGRYNPGLFEIMRRSVKIDPRWGQLIAQHNAIIHKTNREGFRRRNQILTQANQDIMNIITQSWHRRQRILDRGHRNFIKALRDVEVYRDSQAPGGQVELSNQYRHAWRLGDGTYVLTDQYGFNPLRDMGINGQRLTPQR